MYEKLPASCGCNRYPARAEKYTNIKKTSIFINYYRTCDSMKFNVFKPLLSIKLISARAASKTM